MRCNFFLNILVHLRSQCLAYYNLQTFEHNTLINESLLMQFCLFNIRPKFIALTGSYENYASHCSELSQLHQQPVDAALHQTFLETVINCQALKPLHSHRMLIKILSSLLNGAMWAGSVTLNFHNSRYFRCPVWKTKSWTFFPAKQKFWIRHITAFCQCNSIIKHNMAVK